MDAAARDRPRGGPRIALEAIWDTMTEKGKLCYELTITP